jgi:light-regulated signal transduction histidine kinase (bacteriophytochrome)
MARLDVRDRLLVVKKPFDLVEVSQLARMLAAKWELARQTERQIESLRAALEALRESEATVRRSHAELEAFAHSLSHDLRAPLTAMSSFSQLLAEELAGVTSGKALHFLSRIRANAGVAEQLISDLLFLEGVSRAELMREPVDVGELARDLLGALQAAEPQRQVRITIQQGLNAHSDRNLTRIALGHLLSNAWHYTAGDGASIEVGRQSGEDGEPVFYVRDNGRGFDMGYADKLFNRPQRLHRDTEPMGTGLGLMVVHRVVARHAGRVWAESKPGAGSAFFFTLPSR